MSISFEWERYGIVGRQLVDSCRRTKPLDAACLQQLTLANKSFKNEFEDSNVFREYNGN